MKDILGRIKTWVKRGEWAQPASVLAYGMLVLVFCRDVGGVLFLFAAWLLARFVATKLQPKKA